MNPEHPSQWHPTEASQSPAPPRQSSRTMHRGGIVATVAGVALFGALIGVAADRWAVSNFTQNPLGSVVPTITTGPRIGPVAAPNGGGTAAQAAPTAASSDPSQQAIQQVIQQGDNEQAQALASNDPTVMQDTSTSDFYQTQV